MEYQDYWQQYLLGMQKVSLAFNVLNSTNRAKSKPHSNLHMLSSIKWTISEQVVIFINKNNYGLLGKDGNRDICTYYISFTHSSKVAAKKFF